jgi:DNA ligase (NAD+)
MKNMNKLEKMKELIGILNKATYSYYALDKPIMTDHKYDEYFDDLLQLERVTGVVFGGSPTQKVQGYILDGFKKVQHSKPMLSAAKTKDINEIKKFLNNYNWYCSGKLDGMTLVVIYENGQFVQGITRGNGEIGEEVTEGCKFIKNLPMEIPYKDRLEIRGECVMSWEEFNRINQNLSDKYSHPRNLAAGTLRQLDLNIIKERNLSFVVFECVTNIFESKLQELHWLHNNGFETVIRMGQDIGNIEEVAEMMTSEVENDKYPYDGLIFEIDNKTISKKLGKTQHHESCRMALKWADTTYETTLKDIEWNVGKTGVIFPTGIVEPVDLDGAITSRVTLHNITYIKQLELGIGDTVTIYRSNMVIPAIDNNLTRSNTCIIPSYCPICGAPTKVVKTDNTDTLMCTNTNCPGRSLGLWKTFVSKKGMDIDGLSEQTLDKFLRLGYLTNCFVSLYELEQYKKELYKLDGFGKKSVDNLLSAIEKSKDVDLVHFITAFSIPGIGEGQSKLIVKKYPTYQAFIKACDNHERFHKIDGIGPILHTNILTWWDLYHYQMMDVATHVRFKTDEFMNLPENDTPIKGMNFVITGSLNHFSNRDELKNKIESLGGKVVGSVSKNTNYLINNDTASTSSKNEKAKKLGIPIISEEEFIGIIK